MSSAETVELLSLYSSAFRHSFIIFRDAMVVTHGHKSEHKFLKVVSSFEPRSSCSPRDFSLHGIIIVHITLKQMTCGLPTFKNCSYFFQVF
uniref:Uncharacterized protein n=1 Tax=Rhizophora mucronata TaxID=61149 RepID=A0A2P2QDT3_RHIMU